MAWRQARRARLHLSASVTGRPPLEPRYPDELMFSFLASSKNTYKAQWWVGDTEQRQQLAVITIANCGICHGRG